MQLSTASFAAIQGSVCTVKTARSCASKPTPPRRAATPSARSPPTAAMDELARAIAGEPMTVALMLTASPATPCGDRKPEI
ncbi:hypothetical protein U1707_17115 [Sphingomonas sp. PB2P12]|uniref:hypothetical protein n=1 Tax=Sphingomonas sandaracina TaxID=3096157 RepID=UPI002FC88C31